jgi:hypothetical protein
MRFNRRSITDNTFHRKKFHLLEISPISGFTDSKFSRKEIARTENYTHKISFTDGILPKKGFTDKSFHRI